MPGMNSGPSPASPILVSAFRSALLHQSLIVALIFFLVLIAWAAIRTATGSRDVVAAWREPRARQLLRVGFGLLWVFDGLLQAQPQMAGGMPSVLQPTADGSPAWGALVQPASPAPVTAAPARSKNSRRSIGTCRTIPRPRAWRAGPQ